MPARWLSFLDPSVLAVPLYLAAILWERRVVEGRRAAGEDLVGFTRSDSLASIGMGAVSLVTVGALNFAALGLAEALWPHRFTDLGTGPLGWAAAIVGWDFAYYWLHRVEHRVRLFWAAHVNHHSSRHFNLTTALRQPWLPVLVLVVFPPLALLGVRPWMIGFAGGFNLTYQFWVHTEAVGRMPRWFEFVMNTPSHHRVHHGANPEYLDQNLGGIFIVWDRLFGTFTEERARVRYGITKPAPPDRLWPIFSHEWRSLFADLRAAPTTSARLRILFGRP